MTSPADVTASLSARQRKLAVGARAAAILVTLAALGLTVGWQINVRLLEPTKGVQGLTESLSFVIIGTSLIAMTFGEGRFQKWGALAALVLTAFSIIQEINTTSFSIPVAMVHEEATAVLGFVSGAMLYDAVRPKQARWAAWIAAPGAGVILVVAVERLSGAAPFFGFGDSDRLPIALLGVMLLALVGLWLALAERGGPAHVLFVDDTVEGLILRSFGLSLIPLAVGPLIGTVVFLRFIAKETEGARGIAALGALTACALVVVTALIGRFVAARVSRPLSALQERAEMITSGDFSPRPPINSPAEVADLGYHFDSMRRAMEQRADIEGLVREATHAVSIGTDLNVAFRSFGHAVSATVRLDRMSLASLDTETESFRIDSTYGTASWRLPVGSALELEPELRSHFDRGHSLVVHDTTLVQGQPMQELASRGLRSFLGVPVIIAGRTRLLVNFESTRPNAFKPQHVTLMQSAVRETAGTLHALLMLDRERQASTRLQQLDSLKNEFVGMVAHDLRSPMNVIAGFADTMRDRWEVLADEQKLEFLGIISRSVRELAELVEDVLHVARIESGELSYQMTTFDLAGLVRRVTDQLASTQPDREVRVRIGENVPLAIGDEQRHWQIISNLITNAFKFSDSESPIDVTVERAGSLIEVAVRDHGIGIRPEDVDRVFGKFSRVDQPGRKNKVKGTGLGLFICKTMVEQQGGSIRVESTVGVGSTFAYTVRTASETESE